MTAFSVCWKSGRSLWIALNQRAYSDIIRVSRVWNHWHHAYINIINSRNFKAAQAFRTKPPIVTGPPAQLLTLRNCQSLSCLEAIMLSWGRHVPMNEYIMWYNVIVIERYCLMWRCRWGILGLKPKLVFGSNCDIVPALGHKAAQQPVWDLPVWGGSPSRTQIPPCSPKKC